MQQQTGSITPWNFTGGKSCKVNSMTWPIKLGLAAIQDRFQDIWSVCVADHADLRLDCLIIEESIFLVLHRSRMWSIADDDDEHNSHKTDFLLKPHVTFILCIIIPCAAWGVMTLWGVCWCSGVGLLPWMFYRRGMTELILYYSPAGYTDSRMEITGLCKLPDISRSRLSTSLLCFYLSLYEYQALLPAGNGYRSSGELINCSGFLLCILISVRGTQKLTYRVF